MGNRTGIYSPLQRDSPCVWIYLKTRRRSLQRSFLFPNFSLGRIRFFLCHGVCRAGACRKQQQKQEEGEFLVLNGFGMIQRYEGLWGPVKVQRSIVSPIISRAWIRIQDFYIFLPWIQAKLFEHLESWILTMSDLRFSSLNPFQTGDSQATETGVKPKNKA